MDDNKFDELIKGKVAGYEPIGFDPSALAGLHQKMASSFVLPWHVIYRSEVISAASVAFLATVIILSQWFFSSQYADDFQNEITALQSQNSSLADLQTQIEFLSNSKPDTLRILQVNERSAETTYLIEEINSLKSALAREQKRQSDSDMIFLGNAQQLPTEIIELLRKQGFILEQDDEIYLVASYALAPSLDGKEYDLVIPMENEIYPYLPIIDDSKTDKATLKAISAANRRKLSKHYWKGIGLDVGPTLQIGKASYNQGSTRPSIGIGLLADVVLSPSLSLETGAIYSAKYHKIVGPELQELALPSVDNSLGPLTRAELDAYIIEIPIGLKYNAPFANKNITGSLGYSAFFYLNEEFEYTHQNTLISGDVINIEHFDKPTVYSGALNASIGLQHYLRRGDKLETSLYFQKGIGKIGVEQLEPNFFGARAVYWITMR